MRDRELIEERSTYDMSTETNVEFGALNFKGFGYFPEPNSHSQNIADLEGLEFPNLRLLNIVDDDLLASRPRDNLPELGNSISPIRKLLTFIDSFWDSPQSISSGETRANPEMRVELDPQPYRQVSDKVKEASRSLRKFANKHSSISRINAQSNMYYSSIPITNLEPEHEGLKILHLTDIHFSEDHKVHNRFSNKLAKFLNPFCPIKETLDLANYLKRSGQKVDVIAFTGDIISGSPKDLTPEALSALEQVFSNSGAKFIFFTKGNHDYYDQGSASAKIVVEKLKALRVQDLTSKHVEARFNGKKIHFIGMDDYSEGQPIPPVSNKTKLAETSILLVHDQSALRADCTEVDLVLSGHYHGGELYIPYLFDGTWLMKLRGFNENINKQVRFWDQLTEKTKSYVGLGSGRHIIFSKFTRPGPSIITLTNAE